MNVVIPLGLFLVLVCFLLRDKAGKREYIWFTVSMLATTVLLAIRYNFGSDYITYHNLYDSLQVSDVGQWEEGHLEFMYVKMLSFFPSFELYIALQTVLWLGSLWWFYKNYADSKYLWLALFFIFFNVAGINTNVTALRTNIVSIIFVPALYCLMNNSKKEKLVYIGLVLLSSLFHRSAIALLPLVLINNHSIWLKNKNSFAIILVGVGLFSVVFKNSLTAFMANYVIESLPTYFEEYSYYLEDYENLKLSGLSTIIYLLQLFVLLNGLSSEKDSKYVVLIKIGIVFMTAHLFVASSLLSRYIAILLPAYIVAFIRSLRYFQKSMLIPVVALVMLLSSWNFYQTTHSRSSISMAIYQTIFSN